jgi:hypothetical protein
MNATTYLQKRTGTPEMIRQSKGRLKILLAILLALAMTSFCVSFGNAADSLKLAPNLSFTDDSSSNFPIMGEHNDDAAVSTVRPTVIFFGTSHCWNTNREAERLIKLYPQYRGNFLFVIVDLNHVSPEQQKLVAAYYRGAIPTIAVVDSEGNVIYDRAGETAFTRGDVSNLQAILNSAR